MMNRRGDNERSTTLFCAQIPAAPAAKEMLDSIPPTLFQKMFQSHKLVGSPGLAWKKQRVITVAFDGGSDELYRLIEQTANEWTALGGQLSFSFTDDAGQYRRWTPDDKSPAANIRIAFDNTGFWSLLGVLARNVDPGDSTRPAQRRLIVALKRLLEQEKQRG